MAVTTVLAQQVRLGAFDSSSVAVPLNPDGSLATNPATGVPYQFVLVSTSINSTDALLVTNKCILTIKATYDGTTWVPTPAYEWTGGSVDKHGNPSGPNTAPSIPLLNGQPPQRIMVSIDTEGLSLNLGVLVGFQ
jgi:hypothetical protein